ncbi:MAG: ribbon-helix-helix domain-containing protein [Thermoplasmatota archaeon]
MEKKISLRVSDEDLEVIDSFISRHEFSNRSEFLREAAMDYINRFSVSKSKKEIPKKVSLPKEIRNTLHYLIGFGYFDGWEHAVQDLIRDGLMQKDLDRLEKQYDTINNMSNTVEKIQQVERTEEKRFMTK